MDNLRIRPLRSQADFETCLVIQKKVWLLEDLHLTPVHHFCISIQTGAVLLGAFLGKEMAGFVYSFPAVFRKRFCQHSHLLAVLPDWQGYGIGKRLKWAQRAECLRRGYNLITWTFDPLQARNANLNLHSLGAIIRSYLPNLYGRTPSLMLGPGVPTDRFFAEWWIRTKRVKQREKQTPRSLDPTPLSRAVRQKPGVTSGNATPKRPDLSLAERRVLVEVPRTIWDLRHDPALIAAWQKAIRTTARHYFTRGYRVDDFILGDRSFYVLHKERNPR